MPSDPTLQFVPASPRETLFRELDAIIRADPTVSTVFGTILTWRGDPKDKLPLAIDGGNSLRLTPQGQNETWWAASEQKGWLVLNVEMLVKSLCWDDLDRAWYAVERSVYPLGTLAARNAVWARLQPKGALTGLVEFTGLPFDPDAAADGVWRATAQMRIEYRVGFNS